MNTIRWLSRAALAVAAALPLSTPPLAAGGSYFLEELFSNADGKSQFIQLVDVAPKGLAGMSLVVLYNGGTRTFVFPASSQLPGPPFGNNVLIVSQSLSERPIFGPGGGASEWDYVMPDGFLPLVGGTISLGSIDQWDYRSIPADGVSALFRAGGVGLPRANSSLGGNVVWIDDSGNEQYVHEFANASFDRHFFTGFDAEISALKSGRTPGWHEIYQDYAGFAGYKRRTEVFGHAVCRFYLPPPSDSHFFTASEQECADVQVRFPQFVLETDSAFYAGLPDPVTAACAPGLSPLYRLWNPSTNDHWYTPDGDVRRGALMRGYVPEGYGTNGVGMCVIGNCFDC